MNDPSEGYQPTATELSVGNIPRDARGSFQFSLGGQEWGELDDLELDLGTDSPNVFERAVDTLVSGFSRMGKLLGFGTTVDPESGRVVDMRSHTPFVSFSCNDEHFSMAPPHPNVLTPLALSQDILAGKHRNIVVLVGAGLSTAAGIPDFRSRDTGLYFHIMSTYNVARPEMLLTSDYFRTNPKPFFHFLKEVYPGSFRPTLAHYFLRMLHEKGLLLRIYTQNIDGLESLAGIPEEKIVAAHGTFSSAHCSNHSCCAEASEQEVREAVFSDKIPYCKHCSGIIKPDILMFGDPLPRHFFSSVYEDFPKADLIVIMGTSLTVQPFASLAQKLPDTVPTVFINTDATSAQKTQERMDSGRNVLCVTGTADEASTAFSKRLGYNDELNALREAEWEELDRRGFRQAVFASGYTPSSQNSEDQLSAAASPKGQPSHPISTPDQDQVAMQIDGGGNENPQTLDGSGSGSFLFTDAPPKSSSGIELETDASFRPLESSNSVGIQLSLHPSPDGPQGKPPSGIPHIEVLQSSRGGLRPSLSANDFRETVRRLTNEDDALQVDPVLINTERRGSMTRSKSTAEGGPSPLLTPEQMSIQAQFQMGQGTHLRAMRQATPLGDVKRPADALPPPAHRRPDWASVSVHAK